MWGMCMVKKDLLNDYYIFSVLAFFLMVFLVLILPMIGENDFWIDESFNYFNANRPVQDLIFEPMDVHPPLSYIIHHVWQDILSILGINQIPAFLRSIGILFYLIGAYYLGKIVYDKTLRYQWTAFITAFYLISGSVLYHVMEYRMYPILLMFSFMAWFYYFKWESGDDNQLYKIYLLCVLMVLTHYFSVFMFLLFILYTKFVSKTRSVAELFLLKTKMWLFLFLSALYVAWYFVTQMSMVYRMWLQDPTWISYPSSLLYYVLRPVNASVVGNIFVYFYVAVLVCVVALIVKGLFGKTESKFYSLVLLLMPIIFLLIGFKTNTYHHRYLLVYCVPVLLLLSVTLLRESLLKGSIFVYLCIFFIMSGSVLGLSLNSHYRNTELQSIASYLYDRGEIIIIHEGLMSHIPTRFYLSHSKNYLYQDGNPKKFFMSAGASILPDDEILTDLSSLCDFQVKQPVYYLQSTDDLFGKNKRIIKQLDGIAIFKVEYEKYCQNK